MKLAILGTGMIVKEALPVLKEIKGIDLVGLLSTKRSLPLAQDLAKTFGIDFVTDNYEELLKSDAIDTVYVALPNHLHYRYAKEALLAGKHVICEKPFTLNLADLDELIALAREKKVCLLEAITNQYLEGFDFLKANLPKLGDVKIVSCNYSQYSSRYDAFKAGEIAPAFDVKQGGGALRDLNIYNIHLVVGLFGLPKTVDYAANIARDVDTSGILTMDYGNFKAVCIGSKDSSAPIVSAIQGEKGSLIIEGPTNSLPTVSLDVRGKDIITQETLANKHRMTNEFITFEAIISQSDMEAMETALLHSHHVMQVLDEACKSF